MARPPARARQPREQARLSKGRILLCLKISASGCSGEDGESCLSNRPGNRTTQSFTSRNSRPMYGRLFFCITPKVGARITVVTRRLQCAVKGAGPQREERPARELDLASRLTQAGVSPVFVA